MSSVSHVPPTAPGRVPIRIVHIADAPQIIPLLAEWHHRQWGHLARARTVPERIAHLQEQTTPGRTPATYVAMLEDTPIGCASLVVNDMAIVPDWTPWIAAVYVEPSHRHQGLGAALVNHVTAEAAAQGYRRLYLYTHDRMAFYQRLGWEVLFRRAYRGDMMTAMARDLHPTRLIV